MTELLFSAGCFVFMLTVYGAVMIGGHLLESVQTAEADNGPGIPTAQRFSSASPPPATEPIPARGP